MPKLLHLAAAAPLVPLCRLAIATGLRPRPDGWRRAACLVLRNERSTFVLSAFGLRADGAHATGALADRLGTALRLEPLARLRIRRGSVVDSVIAGTGASFTLRTEPMPQDASRFAMPRDWSGGAVDVRPTDAPADSSPIIDLVARVHTGRNEFDVWLRFNHAATDGVPAQELVSRLEQALGTGEQVLYPEPDQFTPRCEPMADAPGVAQLQCFLDFAPLLAWRKDVNARIGEPLTLSAALTWRMGQLPEFRDVHFGSTVESVHTPGPRGLPRGVGVVVARPGDFVRGHASQDAALAAFAREINRRVDAARTRSSGAARTLDAAACLPPALERSVLHHALDNMPSTFGHLGITMLKDAKVFGAPLADAGHPRGFVAVGAVNLPTGRDGLVGCVTVKGRAEVISRYAQVLMQAIRGGSG
jgi:hypothetical protein